MVFQVLYGSRRPLNFCDEGDLLVVNQGLRSWARLHLRSLMVSGLFVRKPQF